MPWRQIKATTADRNSEAHPKSSFTPSPSYFSFILANHPFHVPRTPPDFAEIEGSQYKSGDYLADQLLLPMALAGGGSFRCTSLTEHFKTNAEIIQKFLPISISTQREDRLAWRVNIQPA